MMKGVGGLGDTRQDGVERVRHALQLAFANWMPSKPGFEVVNAPGIETKEMVRRLEGMTWQELLVSGDLSIEPIFLSQDAWFYYLPAFLLMERKAEGFIGYDLEILLLPPSLDPGLEPVSIGALLTRLTSNQTQAIKKLVGLHCALSTERRSSEPAYACHVWNTCWRSL